MAENCSKSKLKRKKSCVEDVQPENPPKKSSVVLPSRDADRSSLPAAAAWWNKVQPPAVESLWAFTLMSALPHLQNQCWDPVPDLPLPPAAQPAAPTIEEQWTYDLFSEVPPFPGNYPPTQEIPSIPAPQSSSSPPENVPEQTTPSLKTPERSQHSHCRQSPEQQHEPPRPLLSTSQRPTVHWWERGASSVEGYPRVTVEQEQTSAPVGRLLLNKSPKVSNPPVSTGEGQELQEAGKREEAALQSCPICLHEFPAGLTQMERDGHLAQCLSEINVDMTW